MKKLIFLIVLLIYGCCSTSNIQKEYVYIDTLDVKFPAATFQIELKDSLFVEDSVGIGEVRDSLNNVIGNLEVYYKKKIAFLLLHPKEIKVPVIDTVQIEVPVPTTISNTIENFGLRLLQIFFTSMSIIEKLIIFILVTAGLFIYFKFRKNKKETTDENSDN